MLLLQIEVSGPKAMRISAFRSTPWDRCVVVLYWSTEYEQQPGVLGRGIAMVAWEYAGVSRNENEDWLIFSHRTDGSLAEIKARLGDLIHEKGSDDGSIHLVLEMSMFAGWSKDLAQIFGYLGEGGWELVTSYAWDDRKPVFLFKRPLKQ